MRTILYLLTFCLLGGSIYAAEDTQLKLENVRVRGDSETTILAVGIKNVSDASIKAFRANLVRMNDFNEGKQVCKIEFSSDSEYRGPNEQPTSHHVIKSGETVFYVLTIINNETSSVRFFSRDSGIPAADGQYHLSDIKVVADESTPSPSTPTLDSQRNSLTIPRDAEPKIGENDTAWFTVLTAYNDTSEGRLSARQDQALFTRLLSFSGDNYAVAIYKSDNGKLAVTMGDPQNEIDARNLADIAERRKLSPTAYPRSGKSWKRIQ